ncbi:MAG TPA: prepilin-type N-terminal cleavage/methylation domain-containing protein [Phycisphaerales bacterium]|nr:prepilin-type N-terminal cleavage/methylation domain-containing protein [Phycisphaerales bacterium]
MHAHMTLQHARTRRPAMTLLEVLIALVLLAALAAIVAPTVIKRLDERAFEAAADGTNEQLMMARAHAQVTGEAVEVTYSPMTGQVQARVYAPWDAQGALDTIEPGTSPLASSARENPTPRHGSTSERDEVSGLPASNGGNADADSSNRAIAEAWAIRPLGRGMRIGTHPPFAGDAADMEEICMPDGTMVSVARDSDADVLDALAQGQDVRLAVFMPDGSAMVGNDLWLDDGQGRLGRITINPWSGLPMFHRLSDLTDESMPSGNNSLPADQSAADDAWPSTKQDSLIQRPARGD